MSKYGKQVNKLLDKISKGDDSAFKELFDFTANHLRAFALVLLDNKNDIDNVILDTFERVFLYVKSSEKRDGYNWMCQITKHVAIDYNKRQKEIVADTLQEISENVPMTDDHKGMFNKTLVDEIFSGLSDEEKQLLDMRYFLDLTYDEIAKRLSIKSRFIVRDQIEKIIKKLKEKYQD